MCTISGGELHCCNAICKYIEYMYIVWGECKLVLIAPLLTSKCKPFAVIPRYTEDHVFSVIAKEHTYLHSIQDNIFQLQKWN